MERRYWSSDRYDREAQLLYESGDYEGARRLLREGLTAHPGSVELEVSLGYAELACEEYGWARRAFERVLSSEPDHEDALVGLGECLLKLDRSRAFLIFERVIDLGFARDTELMLAIGRGLYREGLFERAISFFEAAVTADPSCAEAHAELAYTLYNMGRGEEALGWLGKALEIDPEHHEARAFCGNLLYDSGDLIGAMLCLEKVPAKEFWDPLAVWRTVELLRSFGDEEAKAGALEPYLARLDELTKKPSPEERLLAEIETGSLAALVYQDPAQLDLFGLAGRPSHVVKAGDGRVYYGDWRGIVRAMRDDSPDPTMSISEFMRLTALTIQQRTGMAVPHDDPEAFLRGSARAGALEIRP